MWFWCDTFTFPLKAHSHLLHVLLQPDTEQVLGTRQSHPTQPFSAQDVGEKLERGWHLPQHLPSLSCSKAAAQGAGALEVSSLCCNHGFVFLFDCFPPTSTAFVGSDAKSLAVLTQLHALLSPPFVTKLL